MNRRQWLTQISSGLFGAAVAPSLGTGIWAWLKEWFSPRLGPQITAAQIMSVSYPLVFPEYTPTNQWAPFLSEAERLGLIEITQTFPPRYGDSYVNDHC